MAKHCKIVPCAVIRGRKYQTAIAAAEAWTYAAMIDFHTTTIWHNAPRNRRDAIHDRILNVGYRRALKIFQKVLP